MAAPSRSGNPVGQDTVKQRQFAFRSSILGLAGLALILVVGWFSYVPGHSGPFLFDDHVNLDILGERGGVSNWNDALAVIFGDKGGPSGRPISMASFLLDDWDWPSERSKQFKETNTHLHSITGLLLIWLLLKLARGLGYDESRAAGVALIGGAVWILHPLWTSTVLYVVQRMTILAALFVVAGLFVFAHGRIALAQRPSWVPYAWMSLGIALFTPLAVFSKENGALLPLLAWVLAATVCPALPIVECRRYRVWATLFLYLPVASLVGYLLVKLPGSLDSYEFKRPFSLPERVMTEARILWDYLGSLAVPRIQTQGLYYDNFPISTGLLSPVSTLFALLGLGFLLGFGLYARRRFPVVACAILFFFAGHLIESTIIPLELYFEHRNYLPAMMFAPLAGVGVIKLWQVRRILAVAAVVLTLGLLSGMTYARSQLWGDPVQLSLVWARENPDSVRAQQQAALTWATVGDLERARSHLQTGIAANPDSAALRMMDLDVACRLGQAAEEDLAATVDTVRNGRFSAQMVQYLENLQPLAQERSCDTVNTQALLRIVDAAFDNPMVKQSGGFEGNMHHMKGRFLLNDGQAEAAVTSFGQALDHRPDVGLAIVQAVQLASYSEIEQGLRMLTEAERLLKEQSVDDVMEEVSGRNAFYGSEIDRLRELFREKSGQSSEPGE